MPWRGPEFPGEFPTLGFHVLDWFSTYLTVPDGVGSGEPLVLTPEQVRFILRFYRVDPDFDGALGPVRGRAFVNARTVRRAVLSRPKGWGKSPILAGMCLCEALGPVVLDGWDADGEPVPREWTSLGFKARVQVVAVTEDQTSNTWDPVLDMARHPALYDSYDIDVLDTFVTVPRGRIEYATSSPTSREGWRPVFYAMDQTESWTPANGGRKLAATLRRNLAKVQGASIEAPNAYVPAGPGQESVAQRSHKAWLLQQEGKLRGNPGLLVDHREMPADTDIEDRDSLHAGLAYAYGDSADVNGGWVSIDRQIEEFWDPDTEPEDARRYYGNQIQGAPDAWINRPDWLARSRPDIVVARGEVITLGFDGSRGRSRDQERKRRKGKADATALVACRVRDGHLFKIRVWEHPDNQDDWRVPMHEVETVLAETFGYYTVVGFYADPAKNETTVATWEAKYGPRLKVKATAAHPIEWWMTGGRAGAVVQATAELLTAIEQGEMTHDGSSAMERHFLAARRRLGKAGTYIAKEHPESENKIDLAVASILAWQARLEAVAKGFTQPDNYSYAAKRIR